MEAYNFIFSVYVRRFLDHEKLQQCTTKQDLIFCVTWLTSFSITTSGSTSDFLGGWGWGMGVVE